MKKKAKLQQLSTGAKKQQRVEAPRPVVDPEAVARRVEAALARGDLDIASQLLSDAKLPAESAVARDLGARVFLAQALARWDKPARAMAWLERAVQAAPDRADLHRLYGHLLRRSGALKRAIVELEEARRLAPHEPRIAYEVFLARMAQGARDDLPDSSALLAGPLAGRAAALLAALEGDTPTAIRALARSKEPVDLVMRGILLLPAGGASSGGPLLERAASRDQLPDSVRAYASLYLGIARVQLRQLDRAREALEQARALGAPLDVLRPHLAWVYQQLAIDAVLGGSLTVAAEWLKRLADLGGPEAAGARESVAHALSLEGQVRAKEGDYGGAARVWAQALEVAPHDAALRQNLAVALERAGRIDEAIPHWHELARQAPRGAAAGARRAGGDGGSREEDLPRHIRAVAHRHLADLYLEQEEMDRAIDQLERALQAVPADVDTRRTLAQLLAEEGQTRKAVLHYQQVLAAQPESVPDHVELGMDLVEMGDEQRGLTYLERALSLQPDHPAARSAMGLALVRRVLRSPGAPSALDEARRVLELAPPEGLSLAHVAYGAALLAQGDRRGAKKSFSQAVRASTGTKIAAHLRIGDAYWAAGDRESAVKAWETAMKKAKRAPMYYDQLAEAWAKAGDEKRCLTALQGVIGYSGGAAAAEVVERISRSREALPVVSRVVRELAGLARNSRARARVAGMMLLTADPQGARTLANEAVLQAMEEDDYEAISIVCGLDNRFRILDRRTAIALSRWFDSHPDYLDEE